MNARFAVVGCLVLTLLAGCAEKQEPMKEELARAEHRVEKLSDDVAKLRDRIVAKEYATTRLEETVQDLEIRLRETERRLARSESELNQLRSSLREREAAATHEPKAKAAKGTQAIQPKAVTATPPAAKPAPEEPPASGPAISVYSAPDLRLDDFIESPGPGNSDLFPFRISNLSGSTSVIGTHKSTRLVETAERYRDDVGKLVPRWREEEVEVREYQYVVTFDVENLTRSAKELYASAGQMPLRLTIAPGETVKGVTLTGSLGAKLNLESGNITRRFDVDYAPAAE